MSPFTRREAACEHSTAPSRLSQLEARRYIAKISDTAGNAKLLVKLGPKRDMGEHAPSDNWKMAAKGHNFAVWERA
jgi:hypothetical protein